MPPRKRIRGPKLSPVKEDVSSESSKKSVTKKKEKTVEELELEDAEFEAVADVVSAPPRVTVSAKLKNAQRTLRENVTNSFRQIFLARANIEDSIRHSSQQLLAAFKKTTRAKNPVSQEVFFNEFDIRLGMMIEDRKLIENRARAFKMVCEAACHLLIDGNEEAMLDFLVNNFFSKWLKSRDEEVRANIATFIGYLFESGVSKRKCVSDFSIFSTEYSRKLYSFLLTLLQDKTLVRVPTIRAISVLQKSNIPTDIPEAVEITPRECLMRSFRDIAWECRLAAIEVFEATLDNYEEIARIALYDRHTKVRCIALKKLGSLPIRASDANAMLHILYTCLNDHDIVIRDATRKNLIETWIRRLANNVIKKYQKPPQSDDVIEITALGCEVDSEEAKYLGYGHGAHALFAVLAQNISADARNQIKFVNKHVLDVTRMLYRVDLDPIDCFAESIIEDTIADEQMLFSRANAFDMVEADAPIEVRTGLVFFWRLLIEYLTERANNSNDAIAAVERMAPKMIKMCGIVRMALERAKTVEETGKDGSFMVVDQDLYFSHQCFLLQNLLLSMRHLDRDPTGLTGWKRLLEDMLYNINNPKGLVDVIVQDLVHFHDSSPDSLLNDVSGMFSDMLKRAACGDQTLRDETVFIGSGKTIRMEESDRQVLIAITDYELMVFNSLLKTSIFVEMFATLKVKYQTLAIPKLRSSIMEERILAMECVGILGMIDLKFVETELLMCLEMCLIDAIPFKITFFQMVTDLCVTHGTSVVQEMLTNGQIASGKRKNAETIVKMMCSIILSEEPNLKNSELVLRCCEGLGKLLLHEDIDPDDKQWKQAMITLLSRLNYKLDGPMTAKIRSMITTLLKFFASLTRNNQLMIIRCFNPFFTEWDTNRQLVENAGDTEHIYSRLCRCAALFAILSRHSILRAAEQKSRPCHINLLTDAFKELLYHQESSASNYYCEVMPWIEFDSIQKDDLNLLLTELNDLILIYEDDDSKGRLAELKKLRKRMMKVAGLSDRAGEVMEENCVEVKEEPVEMNEESRADEVLLVQPPVKVKRNAPRSATKGSVTKQDVAGEIRNLMDSPTRENGKKKKIQRPPSESRAHLSRAARRLRLE